jgi:DNA-directed RNA polymerase subunit RPC12/RpoP
MEPVAHRVYACMTCGQDLDEGQYLRLTRDPEARIWTCDACSEPITDAQAERIDARLKEKGRERKEKDRERNSRIVLAVVAAAVAGGIATAWVPRLPRHGGNIEILRFGLRWLLAAAVLDADPQRPLTACVGGLRHLWIEALACRTRRVTNRIRSPR